MCWEILFSLQIRYFYRGFDHPYTINEAKDQLWKLRENWIIQNYPGVQYPYVSKQMMPPQLPDKMYKIATPDASEAKH